MESWDEVKWADLTIRYGDHPNDQLSLYYNEEESSESGGVVFVSSSGLGMLGARQGSGSEPQVNIDLLLLAFKFITAANPQGGGPFIYNSNTEATEITVALRNLISASIRVQKSLEIENSDSKNEIRREWRKIRLPQKPAHDSTIHLEPSNFNYYYLWESAGDGN